MMALPVGLWLAGLVLMLAGYGFIGVPLGIVGLYIGVRRWQARRERGRDESPGE